MSDDLLKRLENNLPRGGVRDLGLEAAARIRELEAALATARQDALTEVAALMKSLLERAETAEADARSWRTVALSNQAIAQSYQQQRDAAQAGPAVVDPDDDARDGVLFRFWIRAGSFPGGWPGRLSELMRQHGPKGRENVEPRHYRAALLALAEEKGVNLP